MNDQQALDIILDSLLSYRIDEKRVALTKTVLGQGGFGVVVLGEIDRSFWTWKKGRLVAVKQLQASGTPAENRKLALALTQELHVWAGLAHPNILRLDGFFLDDRFDRAWLISPYMKNGNIRNYLDKHQPDMIVRIRMFGQTAKGVFYLHERNICHCDIKEANILVDDDGQAKLCDFGLTKVMGSGTTAVMSPTRNIGTMRYMAPELFNDMACTEKSDIWAWGCLGLAILFDQIPYENVNEELVIRTRIILGVPPIDLDSVVVHFGIKELFKGCWIAELKDRVHIKICVKVVGDVIDELMQHQAKANPDETLSAVTSPTFDDVTSFGAIEGGANHDSVLATPSSSSDEEGVPNPSRQNASAEEPLEEIIRLAPSDGKGAPPIIVVHGLAEISTNALPSLSSDGGMERGRVGSTSTSGEPSSAASSSHQQIERHRQEHVRGPAEDQSLHDRAASLVVLYRATRNPIHLNQAIEDFHLALLSRPEGHPERHNTLQRLGYAKLDKYCENYDLTHLDEAIALFRQTLLLRPEGHSERHETLGCLGVALRAKYGKQEGVAALDEAVELNRQTLLLRPEGHFERHNTLQNLGISLRARYLKRSNLEDMHEALECFRRALLLRPEGHSERHYTLQHFGHSLVDKYNKGGDVTDIDKAIDSYRKSLLLLHEGHPERGHNLFGLATSLVHKYRKNGDSAHLDEGIEVYRRTLLLQPEGHPERQGTIQSLGHALVDKYTKGGDLGHLDEAILLIRPVLSQLPIGQSQGHDIQRLFDKVLVMRSSVVIESPAQEVEST